MTQRTTDELLASARRHNSPNYAPADVIFDRGQGVRLYDREGNEYLDFIAGIAVCALGHGHPALSRTIAEQAARLLHVSNLYYTEPQIALMERLCRDSFGDRVFLCNSGAEANEAALKLARRYQHKVTGDADKTQIVSMKQSFHGRTLAAITATGQPKYHEGFAPLVPGFVYAEFNDLDSVKELVGPQTAAVIVEPIQGEGGVRPARPGFLPRLRELCDAHGALLIFDEVQTGVGRTGDWFAYQHEGIAPDIMTLAKGLGGGVPIGAMIATDRAFAGWDKGSHASTFGGNPLASAAALTVLETIEREDLLGHVRVMSEQLVAGLHRLKDTYDLIGEVRGRGLLLGMECRHGATEIANLARTQGLLINTAGGDTLRFAPPLIIDSNDIEQALERLDSALSRYVDAVGVCP
jgi:acetylornithine/N-succinyldiaminopimelate aminotransferase